MSMLSALSRCLSYFSVSNFLSRPVMSSAPRKRRGTDSSKPRASNKRRRSQSTASTMAEVTEPIELEESGEEVVDLTCESTEPVVVDLTHNDSVVIVEEHQSERGNASQAASCILSSDDEDLRDLEMFGSTRRSRDLASADLRSTAGNVSCPICLDGYSEITQSGRLIVSTKCGHIFCSQCLRDALKNVTSCPTCRKKLTHKQYHPIYI